jgi:hypothetical protein
MNYARMSTVPLDGSPRLCSAHGMTGIDQQLIISVLTIVCSGVISAVVVHKLATSRAEREFRRKKLEELYSAVHRYCNHLTTANLMWLRVMSGELNYNEGLELLLKQTGHLNDRSHETAVMLINIYFPELRQSFQALLERRDRITGIHSQFKAAYKEKEPCEQFRSPFAQELLGIDADEKAITDRLFKLAERERG